MLHALHLQPSRGDGVMHDHHHACTRSVSSLPTILLPLVFMVQSVILGVHVFFSISLLLRYLLDSYFGSYLILMYS